MTPGIFLRCTYKIDVIHVGEGLHLCAGFFQKGLGCKAEEEEESFMGSPCLTPQAEGIGSAPLMSKCGCCP